MGMYYPPMRSDEIYHWGIEKGKESKNHKYFNRILLGNKNGQNLYRYFYDKASWLAYNNNLKTPNRSEIRVDHDDGTSTVIREKPKGPSLISRILFGEIGSRLVEKGKEIVKNVMDDINNNNDEEVAVKLPGGDEIKVETNEPTTLTPQDIIDPNNPKDGDPSTTNAEGEAAHKYVGKVKLPDGTYKYFYDEKELEEYYATQGTSDEKDLANTFGIKHSIASEEDDMAEVNEKYKQEEDGTGAYQNNCYACTLAYELRRRGYDVEASPDYTSNPSLDGYNTQATEEWNAIRAQSGLSDQGATTSDEMQMYKDVGLEDVYMNLQPASPKDFTLAFASYAQSLPEGARGSLNVQWLLGGGHCMAWEVTNGELVIRDCQVNRTYKGSEIIELMENTKVSYEAGACNFFRTDDKTLNAEVIKLMLNKN